MKKLIYTLPLLLLFNITVHCQSQYVFIEYKNAQRPAVQNEFSYPDKTVTDAIEDKLSKMGYKGKDSKGYTVYKNVVLPELGGQPYDLYFKVDRKSRKDKDVAVVNMLVAREGEIFLNNTSDSMVMNNAKNYLNSLLPSIESYDLQQQVNAQQEAVTKAEKKYSSLKEDADDLFKKKKKLEQQIDDNIKAQKEQQAEIEKQKQLFETVKARQKQ